MSDGGTGDACDRSWARWKPSDTHGYVDNGDGTLTDTVTHLTWVTGAGPVTSWPDAIAHCAGLELAGHCDFRLPTRVELSSIVDYTASTAPVTDARFQAASSGYWTASPMVGMEGMQAWWINFNDGLIINNGAVSTLFNVRCVR
jgi:hypothetical protein